MTRNLEYENKLYEIENGYVLNSYFLLHLMNDIKSCTVNQLATALYLFRFTNVTTKILEKVGKDKIFKEGLPSWDIYNLDTVLTPYLLEKYNDRFKKGFMNLMIRGLIDIDNNQININTAKINLYFNMDESNITVNHKSYYISLIIKKFTEEKLDDYINSIVGDLNNE